MGVQELFQFLVAAGSSAPSADNMQPWRFRLDADDLVLMYDTSRIGKVIFPVNHQATLITMGAVIENIHQACRHLGLNLAFETGIPDSAPFEFLRVRLPLRSGNIFSENLPWLHRHTNRLPFSKAPLPSSLKDFLSVQAEGQVKTQVISTSTAINNVARLVRLASQVRFQTREIHDWFSRSLRFSQEQVQSGNGLDVATFDLPPGGRALLKAITADWRYMSFFNQCGGYKFLAAVEAASIAKAGAIIAIVGPGDSADALNAGRLMERIWVVLNVAGYGVQPYYVVSDQLTRLAQGSVPPKLQQKIRELEKEAASSFHFKGNDCLHMLLRVGLPIRSPKRSLRLPQQEIVLWNRFNASFTELQSFARGHHA